MQSYLFLAYAAFHLGLLGWGWRQWGPAGRPVALTMTLVANTLLWYDNFRIGIGRFIGPGDLLHDLSMPAFVWHWTMVPVFMIVAGSIARLAGFGWARNRAVMGLFCLGALALFAKDLPYTAGLLAGDAGPIGAIEIRPACIGDTVRYSTKVAEKYVCAPGDEPIANGPSPFPAIAMNVVMFAVGIALWARRRWPWLAVGPGLMFIAAAPLWGEYAMPVANFGEILFTVSVMATILRFSPGRRGTTPR